MTAESCSGLILSSLEPVESEATLLTPSRPCFLPGRPLVKLIAFEYSIIAFLYFSFVKNSFPVVKLLNELWANSHDESSITFNFIGSSHFDFTNYCSREGYRHGA